MNSLEEFKDLQNTIESLKKDLARGEGVITQLKADLEKAHGCKTLSNAKLLLTKLKDKQAETKKKYEEKLKEYKQEYKTRILAEDSSLD